MDPKEKYRFTFLNASVFLCLIYLIIFSVSNWSDLNSHGGWGVLGVIILGLLSLFVFVIDGILQVKVKNKGKFRNVSLIFAFIYLLVFFANVIVIN